MENLDTSRKLKMWGMVLFLLGLLTGFVIMTFENPRQGLAAHLEGVMNGIFLVVVGIVWTELMISPRWRKVLFWTLLYGTITNWLFTLLGAIWGTSQMTPIAGAGYGGSDMHEKIVMTGLMLVGLSMVFSLAVMVYGLRGRIIHN